MKNINLFIDELGSASPKSTASNIYLLSGIMISRESQEDLKIKADQIKFKYFNNTEIVFHSRDIGRKQGVFIKLQDISINSRFERDIIKLLNTGSFRLFSVLVDKQKIPKNWTEKTIYKKTSDYIIKNFILALLAQKNCHGRLIVESATSEKDFYYHKAANYYLSNGFKSLGIDYSDVQNVLTEISFVTKKNNDIEEQVADLLAYGIKLKYQNNKNQKYSWYENALIKVVENKLFTINPQTGQKKKRFYSQIQNYKILP
jgi:hypothetical protein